MTLETVSRDNLISDALYATVNNKQKTFSVSFLLLILYLFLIFLVMPTSFYSFTISSEDSFRLHGQQSYLLAFSRISLYVGILMMFTALVTKRRLYGMTLPISVFIIYGCSYILMGILGPFGIFETSRLFFAQTGIGICLVLILSNQMRLTFFLKALLIVALLNAIYGLVFTVPGLLFIGKAIQSVGMPPGITSEDWRLAGTLGDPTNCGLLLMFGFLISLNKLLEKINWLNTMSFAILTLAIFLTFSRTTWVALFFGVLSLVSTKKVTFNRVLFLLILGIFFCFFTYGIISFAASRNLFRLDIMHSDTRSSTWVYWGHYALRNLLGNGIGSIDKITAKKEGMQSPHNIYLHVLIEGGLQTLIPLLLLMWISFRRLWIIKGTIKIVGDLDYRPLCISLMVSIFIGLFALNYMLQLLFIAMGISFAYILICTDIKRSIESISG